MVERKRHLAKALTWRFLGSIGTVVIAYIATGDTHVSVSIGLLDTVAKIGFYYVHERAWYRIKWGIRGGSEAASPHASTDAHAARD